MATPQGATIRVFLPDGTPQGIRVVELSGWTGVCLSFYRPDYARVRLRPELRYAGVYVLLGTDENGPRVYVGEADEVRTRLDAHQVSKQFWTLGCVLTTTNRTLNKAHVRYLEARLLSIAGQASKATLDNGTAPSPPHLSESEKADMEGYLANALTLLPLAGVSTFDLVPDQIAPSATVRLGPTEYSDGRFDTSEPSMQDVPAPDNSSATAGESSSVDVSREVSLPLLGVAAPPARAGVTYSLKLPSTVAEGRDDPGQFTVFSGALARLEEKTMTSSYKALRDRLIAQGVLVPENGVQLRLTRTYGFDSPSAAASVLSASSINGTGYWKTSEGLTLNQVRQGVVR